MPAFARSVFLARYGEVFDMRIAALALPREVRVPECVGIYTAVSPVTRCGPVEYGNA